MSLYHEAGQLLTTATKDGASLKSIAFGKTDWKSDRRTLFALATEASKWSEPLSEVIEKSGLLALEKQVAHGETEDGLVHSESIADWHSSLRPH